jgi:K+-sensing histidine kinase KdpD
LKNSKKFHPSNSPSIEICVFSVSQYICFRISDDGMHLSPEQLSKMWLPYHQAEKFFTGELPGMGLGLSKIAFMVSSAGGSCKSYNRSGCPGIVVEIMLPVLTE